MPENIDPQYLAFVQERFVALESTWELLCAHKIIPTEKGARLERCKLASSIAYRQLVETAEAVELEPLWVDPGSIEEQDGTLVLKPGILDRPEGRWLLEVGNARLGIWFAYQRRAFDHENLQKITLIGLHFAQKALEVPTSVLQIVQKVMGYTDQAELKGGTAMRGYYYLEENQNANALRIRVQGS